MLNNNNNDKVWIKDEDWILVNVLKRENHHIVVSKHYNNNESSPVTLSSPDSTKFDINDDDFDYYEFNYYEGSKYPTDTINLKNINLPCIIDIIKQRILSDDSNNNSILPYCNYLFIGDNILISINPNNFPKLISIGDPIKNINNQNYDSLILNKNFPHPYYIAELSLRKFCINSQLLYSPVSQSIIINGESGSGKTEVMKSLIKYIAIRTHNEKNQINNNKFDTSLFLLECFGNAITKINNNSSRFGKYIKLYFKSNKESNKYMIKDIELLCANVTSYILEKNRVVSFNDANQFNFHIFYILLNNYPSGLFLDGNDGRVKDFHIVNSKSKGLYNSLVGQNMKNTTLFMVTEALAYIGLEKSNIWGIWMILSGLLHLGNIEFDGVDTTEGIVASLSNKTKANSLTFCANNFLVKNTLLQSLLTEREVQTRGERIVVKLIMKDAILTKEAIIKTIYEALFNMIIYQINIFLNNTNKIFSKSSEFIGILDMVGFENFDQNGYDQLMINYANEYIQNSQYKLLIVKETTLLKQELLLESDDMRELPSDNNNCLDLIATGKINNTIFSLLDTISKQSNPSDSRFCEELHKTFTKNNNCFISIHRKDMKNIFCIKHYAGDVLYHVNNDDNNNLWVYKNNYAIPDNLNLLFSSSELDEFKKIESFANINKTIGRNSTTPKRSSSFITKPTNSAVISTSIEELNSMIKSTSCQFIHCINPINNLKYKTSQNFDSMYISKQIKALNIVKSTKLINKHGISTYIPFSVLIKYFIPGYYNQNSTSKATEADIAFYIIDKLKISEEAYILGKSTLFFRIGYFSILESLLSCNKELFKQSEETTVTHLPISDTIELKEKIITNLDNDFHVYEKEYDKLILSYDQLNTFIKVELPVAMRREVSFIWKTLQENQQRSDKIYQKLNNFVSEFNNSNNIDDKVAFDNFKTLYQECLESFNLVKNCLDNCYSLYAEINKQMEFFTNPSENENCQGFEKKMHDNNKLFDNAKETIKQSFRILKDVRGNIAKTKKDSNNNNNDDIFNEFDNNCNSAAEVMQRLLSNISTCKITLDGLSKFYQNSNDGIHKVKVCIDQLNNSIYSLSKFIHDTDKLIKSLIDKNSDLQSSGNKSNQCNNGEIMNYGFLPTPSTLESLNSTKTTIEISPPPKLSSSSSDGWKKLYDRKSARHFYYNEVSKEKSWKKPKYIDDASTDTSVYTNELPHGWKELKVKGTNKIFFYNYITKEKQWRRPIHKVTALHLRHEDDVDNQQVDITDEVLNSPKPRKKQSKKTIGFDTLFLSPENNDNRINTPAKKSKLEIITEYRNRFQDIMTEIIDKSQTPEGHMGRISISYMNFIGREPKRGFLKKQSSILCRWRSKFVVLFNDIVSCYDKKDDYFLADSETEVKKKIFYLSNASSTSFTSVNNCFCLSNPEGGDNNNVILEPNQHTLAWFLKAENDVAVIDWMTFINSHIHVKFMVENNIHSDYWDDPRGIITNTFWTMPELSMEILRRPLGIRSLPIIDGPRTGEGVFPGQVIEVIQIIEDDLSDQRFLRLANDRGWLFESHPSGKFTVLSEIECEYTEEIKAYYYPEDSIQTIDIFLNPSNQPSGLLFEPGSEFMTKAKLVIANDTTYLKLLDMDGWVYMYHPITGTQILKEFI